MNIRNENEGPKWVPDGKVDCVIWELYKNDDRYGTMRITRMASAEYMLRHNIKKYSSAGDFEYVILGDSPQDCFEHHLIEKLRDKRIVTKKIVCLNCLAFGYNKDSAVVAIQELFNMGISVVFLEENLETNTQANVDRAIQIIHDSTDVHYGETYRRD